MRGGTVLRDPPAAADPLVLAELDAVTVDAHGTLLRLRDPVGQLRDALARRGVARTRDEVEAGFREESAHYRRRKLEGGDAAGLAALRAECAAVFLATVRADLDPPEFAPEFELACEPLPAVEETLAWLAAHGLALAVVANWDAGLHDLLARHRLGRHFATVVVSSEIGAAKPDPAPFVVALARLGVDPRRALHVGDEEADRCGATAAGLHFRPAPLAELRARLA